MNVRCGKCGMMNCVDDNALRQGVRMYRCAGCGSVNELSEAAPGQSWQTQMAPPPPPMHVSPPRRRGNGTSLWLIVALAAVLAALGTWYFVSRSGSSRTPEGDVDTSREDQELLIRNFYEECVFGSPRVSQIEDALTPGMLSEVKEGGNRYALYKFVTGRNVGKSGENRVRDIRNVGTGVYRVDYLDHGVAGSTNVYVAREGDVWKIDKVEFLSAEAEKAEPAKPEPVVRSDTYTYSGYVSDPDYKITATLTFTEASGGYTIKGKYAYLSTLAKAGDKASSWIHVTGFVDSNGNFRWEEYIQGNTSFHPTVRGTITGGGGERFAGISGINESGHVTEMYL